MTHRRPQQPYCSPAPPLGPGAPGTHNPSCGGTQPGEHTQNSTRHDRCRAKHLPEVRPGAPPPRTRADDAHRHGGSSLPSAHRWVRGSSTVWAAVKPDDRRQTPNRTSEVKTHRLWDPRLQRKPRPNPTQPTPKTIPTRDHARSQQLSQSPTFPLQLPGTIPTSSSKPLQSQTPRAKT